MKKNKRFARKEQPVIIMVPSYGLPGKKERKKSEKIRRKERDEERVETLGTREVEWWIARRGNESEASDRRYTYQQCGAPVLRGPPRLSANTFLRVPSKLTAWTIADRFLLSRFPLVIADNLPIVSTVLLILPRENCFVFFFFFLSLIVSRSRSMNIFEPLCPIERFVLILEKKLCI